MRVFHGKLFNFCIASVLTMDLFFYFTVLYILNICTGICCNNLCSSMVMMVVVSSTKIYTLGYVINYDYDTLNSQLPLTVVQCQQTLNIDSKYSMEKHIIKGIQPKYNYETM